jgi:hypothetical protein
MQDTSATAPAAPAKLREPSEAQLQCYIQVIRGQTDMSDDDIVVLLKEHNYDMLKVIRSYINGGKRNTTNGDKPANNENATGSDSDAGAKKAPVIERNVQSVNQMRFNEIRNFMDNAAESFRRTQEMNRIYNQVMEKKKTMAAMAAMAAAATAATAATTVSESAAASASVAAGPQPDTNETTQMRSKL